MSNKKTTNATRRNILKGLGVSTVAGMGAAAAGGVYASEAKGVAYGSKSVKRRSAFITGGARGIGLATAIELAKNGYDITLFDIADQVKSVQYPMSTTNDLDNAKQSIEALGAKCIAIKGDVRDFKQLEKAMQRTKSEFGSLDAVVANAAITHFGSLEEQSEEIVTSQVDINLLGVAKTIKAALPIQKEQNSGRIVTLSSITGRGGNQMFSIYSATKWGVIGLTKSIAKEVGYANITCNAICPTAIDTPLLNNDHLYESFNILDSGREGMSNIFKNFHTLPIGILEPTEIANAVKFLISDEAKYISGAVLDVNAGFSASNVA